MKIIDGMPRPSYTESKIGGAAFEKGCVKVALDVNSREIHSRKRRGRSGYRSGSQLTSSGTFHISAWQVWRPTYL